MVFGFYTTLLGAQEAHTAPHHTTPHRHRHTFTHIRSYSLTDVTGWRYLRQPPDSRSRRAQNWARNRTTPNESDEPGSDRAPLLSHFEGPTNTGRRRRRLGHVLATSYLILLPLNPLAPSRVITDHLFFHSFLLPFLFSRMVTFANSVNFIIDRENL